MNLISTSWSCQRCGAAYISIPPEHGICDECIADLEALARLAPIDSHPCPACGGPVCGDCGKALILLIPQTAGALHGSAGEVNRDGG